MRPIVALFPRVFGLDPAESRATTLILGVLSPCFASPSITLDPDRSDGGREEVLGIVLLIGDDEICSAKTGSPGKSEP